MTDTDRLREAERERDEARTEVERLRGLLRRVGEIDPDTSQAFADGPLTVCSFCDERRPDWEDVAHKPDCLWVEVQALLHKGVTG